MAYQWILFLHVSGVLGFMLVHGVPVFIALRLRNERDPERVRALLDLSRTSIGFTGLSLIIVFLTGIVLGFMG
ncbi:MAG: hypothetical protein ACE5IB_05030, partial [Candidatus Geothermarchaeales archaeon]